MSCDCSISSHDFDAPELSDVKIVKARKEHKCCECHQIIKIGEKYQRIKGLWDGEFETYHTCLICSKIRDDYCQGGFIFGELDETLKECLGVGLNDIPI